MKGKPLIILTGPTAVGKTKLSISLAKAVGGEIISADSMQVYRQMDIGSAKVKPEEMEGVVHHLIDVLDPGEEFHVVRFQQMAKEAMEGIYRRGHIPIVTGGTGFYIQALVRDIDFSQAEDPSAEKGLLRKRLEEIALHQGEEALYKMLLEVDPESAKSIHPNNRKRVIRALEYYWLTGSPISRHNEEQKQKTSPYQFVCFVLIRDRAVLYDRINRRVDQMIEEGLVEEVKRLAAMGYTRDMVSMQGLGYKEILDWLNGEGTLPEAIYKIKRDTRHFAKRQITWFKREQDTEWVSMDSFESEEAILKHLLNCCRERGIWKDAEQECEKIPEGNTEKELEL